MTKKKDKRQIIFDAYSNQLKNLKEIELCDIELKFENTYICPICFEQFSEEDLDVAKDNFLTLEDAPPKSLGGKANTLTCKICNNESGYIIDYHLVEKLNELDIHSFLPSTGSKAYLTHKGVKVQGFVKVDEQGKITITHLEKTNNPNNLKAYVNQAGKNDITELEFPVSRVDLKKFEIALLKTAYILAFEKYGYPLILSKAFDIVRKQIKNPNQDIYPSGFWTRQSIFNETNKGVHLITTQGFEGFHSIFILRTKAQESGYGVYLPISQKTTTEIIEKLKVQKAGFILRYMSYKDSDYFNDKENQKICAEFMKKRNS